MCGGIHNGEAEGLVSVERWSCSRGASYVIQHIIKSSAYSISTTSLSQHTDLLIGLYQTSQVFPE